MLFCCCTHTHHPNVPGTCVDWDSCCIAPTRTHAGASCLAQCGPVPLLRSSPEPPDPGPPSAAAEAPSLETLPVLSVEKDETFINTVGGHMEKTERHKISSLSWPWPYHAAVMVSVNINIRDTEKFTSVNDIHRAWLCIAAEGAPPNWYVTNHLQRSVTGSTPTLSLSAQLLALLWGNPLAHWLSIKPQQID